MLSNDFRYFSSEDIRKMLSSKNILIERASLNTNLMKLRVFGILDTKIVAKKRRDNRAMYPMVTYRLKKECLT